MAMTIYNNIPALTSQGYLSQTNSALSKNLERLSSGLRINSAADDASGLAISEKLRGQISGLQRASMNAQDGISLLQTAEGGLSSIQEMTQRMRELAVQAGNGVYTTNDRAEIQKEVEQLKDEINRVASSTEFNTKKLLNGDASALWSTDNGDVIDATVTGKVAEGNYNLNISVDAGTNYVYKSDVMSLNEDAIAAEITAKDVDADTVSGNLTLVSDPVSMAAGTATYTIAVGGGADLVLSADVSATYLQSGSSWSVDAVATTATAFSGYLEVRFEDSYANGATPADQTISFRAIDAKTGEVSEWVTGTLSASGDVQNTIGLDGTFTTSLGAVTLSAGALTMGTAGATQAGDKILFTVSQAVTGTTTDSGGGTIRISDGPTDQTGPRIVYADTDPLTAADNGDAVVDYTEKTVYYASMDESTGNIDLGSLTLSFKENGVGATYDTINDTYSVKISGSGEAATSTTKLSDISRFTTEDGVNIFDETQSLTIFGNGTSTTIYLEGDDTISDFEAKLTTAIVDGLGMGASASTSSEVSDVNNNLVNYVGTSSANTNEAVEGTFVIQTAKLGDDSQLTFVGDQALIDGLSLATIQEGTNSEVTVAVTDAHTGDSIGSDSINDYTLRDVISGVNVNISSDAGVDISWTDSTKSMTFGTGSSVDVKLHVVDNAMEMQIGANEGQTILTSIPQVDTQSLGLDDIVMVDQELAQSAITKIDSALENISSIRATIGAQINRLEYTITGLNTAAENLTASESRIRDLDFASEMTEFTRNQILNQAGTAMLSQANSLPNLVLQLLG